MDKELSFSKYDPRDQVVTRFRKSVSLYKDAKEDMSNIRRILAKDWIKPEWDVERPGGDILIIRKK